MLLHTTVLDVVKRAVCYVTIVNITSFMKQKLSVLSAKGLAEPPGYATPVACPIVTRGMSASARMLCND